MITLEEIKKYNMNDKDIKSATKYGRSVKAFYANKMRARVAGSIASELGLTQDEFYNIDKSQRLSLIQGKIKELVSQQGMSLAERTIRKANSDARVIHSGETIIKETTRNFTEILVDDPETVVAEFIETNGKQTTCALTGVKLVEGHEFLAPSYDHIVPISKGGAHTASNLRIICSGMNRMKYTHTDEQMFKFIDLLKIILS